MTFIDNRERVQKPMTSANFLHLQEHRSVEISGDWAKDAIDWSVPQDLRQFVFDGKAATYVILDAAKVTNLPLLIEASGLAHICLFKGKAFDTLKEVAPWVVRLEDRNAMTRDLFTKGDAPWQMWDKKPGVILRTDADLDAVADHFRRLTRIKAENGKWSYLRLWEPEVCLAILASAKDDPARLSRLALCTATKTPIDFLIPDTTSLHVACVDRSLPASNTPFTLGPSQMQALRDLRWRRYKAAVTLEVEKRYPDLMTQATPHHVDRFCETAKGAGLRKESAIFDYVRSRLHAEQSNLDLAALMPRFPDEVKADEVGATRRLWQLVSKS